MYNVYFSFFLFRSGIGFYFLLFSTVQVTVQPKKKICVFMVTCQKNLGSVGSALNYYYFFLMSGKTGNSRSGIRFRYFILEISDKQSFVEAVL